MRILCAALVLILPFLQVTAAPRWVDSRSGQFRVRGPGEMRRPPLLLQEEQIRGMIVLTPELLAVSAERIKEGVLQQLGARDRWRGKVTFVMDPSLAPDRFDVQSVRYSNGWRYRVALAPKIGGEAWIRGCVGVLLLEMANRLAGQRSAEVPFWLIDAMVQELRQAETLQLTPSHADRIVISPGGASITRPFASRVQSDSLEITRKWLADHAPADITELFFPSRESLYGERRRTFAHSAHFFYRRLLDLPAGKACLIQFLSSLSSRINWQQAFIPAFDPHFERMLDVEKWWSVTLVDLTYDVPVGSWTLEESLVCLERTLVLPALVGTRREQLARRSDFSLQQVVRQWRWEDQEPALERIANRLRILGIYADKRAGLVVRDYLEAIDAYLEGRRLAMRPPRGRMQVRLLPAKVVRETIEKLDSIDIRRRQLVPLSESAGS